jgi:hypothetical protein
MGKQYRFKINKKTRLITLKGPTEDIDAAQKVA